MADIASLQARSLFRDPDAPLVELVHCLADGKSLAEMVRRARFKRKRTKACVDVGFDNSEWTVNTKDDE